jgi:3-hydroxyacyl-[acyl-carrier-protein] dehydratase
LPLNCSSWKNSKIMLIKGLYSYETRMHEGDQIEAVLSIDSSCPLYAGHFPGFAITPGVCQLLMIKEILEEELGIHLQLEQAGSVKFTALHEPDRERTIEAKISYSAGSEGRLGVRGSIEKGETKYLKFRGEFIQQK